MEITKACIVAFIKAKNSLVVWCIDGRKQKIVEMYFLKALAKNFFLTWKSCSWPTFYKMNFIKRSLEMVFGQQMKEEGYDQN